MHCYEEKSCFPFWNWIEKREEAVEKAVEDFTYIANEYFTRPNYWKRGAKPCVVVFSSWGEAPGIGRKEFTPEEWETIVAAAPGVCLARQNYDTNFPCARSAFAWVGDENYTDWFYPRGDDLVRNGKLDFYIGSANPGFDDRGVWGWGDGPRFTANMGLDTFTRYWDAFESSACDVIQIVTWNDFEEGTVIEPTVQFGNLYLDNAEERIAAMRGVESRTEDNSLPYKWFVLRKFAPGEFTAKLGIARTLLARGRTIEAGTILDTVQFESGIDIPPYIDMKHEYTIPKIETPEATEMKKMLPELQTEANIARLARLSASSLESPGMLPAHAIDGNFGSRWASAHTNSQWLLLDFPQPVSATRLVLVWENAYARRYGIETSVDGQIWTTAARIEKGKPGPITIDLSTQPAFKQLRIQCGQRGTEWGFSIREIGLFSRASQRPEI